MRDLAREGKITFIEIFLITCILLLGYWVLVLPMGKTDDMVKKEWVQTNLSTMHDAIPYLEKMKMVEGVTNIYENMTVNDVDIIRASWGRPPLKWPDGVLFDSFLATTNQVSIDVEFSTGLETVIFKPAESENL